MYLDHKEKTGLFQPGQILAKISSLAQNYYKCYDLKLNYDRNKLSALQKYIAAAQILGGQDVAQ
jgi:hypothetical protein